MPELRWSLLALGVLFIVGLVLWERRKRSARERPFEKPVDDLRGAQPTADRPSAEGGGRAERVERAAAPRLADAVNADPPNREPPNREPVMKPRLVEIIDPSVEGLDDVDPELGTLPRFADGADPVLGDVDSRRLSTDDAAERAARWLAETQPSLGNGSSGSGAAVPPSAAPRPALKLDWPADNARRIVALRVVPRTGERFTGGAVRQAFLGEGFELGDFDIFHLPLGDGRVVVSAANLTKPGTFRLATMDAEMFSGLNLFAVLPGPLPAPEAYDRLLTVADLVAQRLRGEVRDHQGQPLVEIRVVELRRELAAWQPKPGAGV